MVAGTFSFCRLRLAAALGVVMVMRGWAADPAVLQPLDALYPEIAVFYQDLHQNPELSLQEEKTAGKLAARLRAAGCEVTERVGGWGVVGVLRNGPGPTVLVRTDMDALPVDEKTGAAYASHATGRDGAGKTVPVMHACGHDIHMSEWVAAATLLSRAKPAWRGTVLWIGQPAEELGKGAEAMLKDHLYERFGKPDFAIALHDHADLPAGKIGYLAGFCYANVDSVDIAFFGKGGHGAYPHKTVDPIVMAARFVTTVQTVVSRDNNPLEPAVITVGSFHAGSKHNIISDEARLQLTVRSYKAEVRQKLLAGSETTGTALAAARGEFNAWAALVAINALIPTDRTARVTLNFFMMEMRCVLLFRATNLAALQLGLRRCPRNPANFVQIPPRHQNTTTSSPSCRALGAKNLWTAKPAFQGALAGFRLKIGAVFDALATLSKQLRDFA